jgi:adenylate cyclase
LELNPAFSIAHGGLFEAYALKGMLKESMEHFEEMTVLDGDPKLAAKVTAAYAKSGYRSAIRVILDDRRLKRLSGRWLPFADDADFYIKLGEKDLCLMALQQAVQQRDPEATALQVDPIFDSIRSDPRFQQLVHRVGLPQ